MDPTKLSKIIKDETTNQGLRILGLKIEKIQLLKKSNS
jgi:hypothetical protein